MQKLTNPRWGKRTMIVRPSNSGSRLIAARTAADADNPSAGRSYTMIVLHQAALLLEHRLVNEQRARAAALASGPAQVRLSSRKPGSGLHDCLKGAEALASSRLSHT